MSMPLAGSLRCARSARVPLGWTPLLLVLGLSPAWAGPCGSPTDLLPDPYGRIVRGEDALEAGRHAEAAAELEAAADVIAGPAARRRHQLLGRAHLASGDAGAATAALKRALAEVDRAGYRASRCDADPAESRWWLAEASPESDRVAIWRTLWTRNPTSPRSADVEALLREHDPAFAADTDLVLARAATLASMHQHRVALALLEAGVPDDGSKAHALMMARALFRAKEYERAVDAIGAIDHAPLPERFDRALAASRLGDYAFAARLYQAIVDEHAHDASPPKLVATASYKLGYLDYDEGRLEAGVEGFRAHLRRFPRSKHATEALWFIGWSLFKLDRLPEAQDAFATLANEHPRSTLVPGARYWMARASGLRGDAEAEAAGLDQIIVRHPDSAYAWWAARRLERTWAAPTAIEAPIGTVFKDDPGLSRGLALQRAGLDDWAAAELGRLTAAARKQGREHSLYLAGRLADSGQWAQSRALARRWCSSPEKRADLTALRLCWPRPEGDTATASASGGGLPAHLPFAIMKAESGFKPGITSPAGARGLMQMMPSLGVARYAELHDGAVLDPEDLYDPSINAELGVSELVELRRGFDDAGVEPSLPLVIAGYNGGAAAVRRWLADQPQPVDAARFAEDISYSETRRYVRRVLGALQVYPYVSGDG